MALCGWGAGASSGARSPSEWWRSAPVARASVRPGGVSFSGLAGPGWPGQPGAGRARRVVGGDHGAQSQRREVWTVWPRRGRPLSRTLGLEVDLGFVPAAGFGPLGDGAFSVVFGSPAARGGDHRLDSDHLVGLAWHHVLHARTSIDRGRPWRAEHWISAVRDLVLTLGCARLGFPSVYAKGADQLPAADLARLEASLVSSLDPGELSRALRAAVGALLVEVTRTDPAVAARITPLLTSLADGGTPDRRSY